MHRGGERRHPVECQLVGGGAPALQQPGHGQQRGAGAHAQLVLRSDIPHPGHQWRIFDLCARASAACAAGDELGGEGKLLQPARD